MEDFYKCFEYYKERAEDDSWGNKPDSWFKKLIKMYAPAASYQRGIAEQIVLCRVALIKNINFE